MKVGFVTFGCKVNQYDTQAMLEGFVRLGFRIGDFSEICDVYLINTCTVTGVGANKSRKAIRQAAARNPSAAIVVAGCLSQQEGAALLSMPGVRLVLGTAHRAKAAELLQDALAQGVSVCAVEQLAAQPFEESPVTSHEGRTRAVLKIQEGCENRCAYCIIPSVRGPVRSRALDSVRQEAARLAAAGFLEIVLTGIHLCSYGKDLSGENWLDAVEAVCRAQGVVRVRLGSLEPSFITEEAAARLAALPELCGQFHLSLQSGSDRVLRRMRRGYTVDLFRQAVGRLRGAMPGCAITTDIIAGFPGEEQADFEQTADFMREMRFARAHIFPYSEREGTEAAAMEGAVPMEVRRQRAAELGAIAEASQRAYAALQVGAVREALFEQPGSGLTREYVAIRAEGGAQGAIEKVKVLRCEGAELYGEIVEEG